MKPSMLNLNVFNCRQYSYKGSSNNLLSKVMSSSRTSNLAVSPSTRSTHGIHPQRTICLCSLRKLGAGPKRSAPAQSDPYLHPCQRVRTNWALGTPSRVCIRLRGRIGLSIHQWFSERGRQQRWVVRPTGSTQHELGGFRCRPTRCFWYRPRAFGQTERKYERQDRRCEYCREVSIVPRLSIQFGT